MRDVRGRHPASAHPAGRVRGLGREGRRGRQRRRPAARERMPNRVEVVAGILEPECAALLRGFFQDRR